MATQRGPDGTGRIAISGTWQGQNWANVYWVNCVGGVTASQTDWTTLVTNFGDQFFNTLKDELDQGAVILQYKGTLFQPNSTALQAVVAVNHPGLISAGFVNDSAACRVISWVTNVYWRGGKPRTYLVGIPSAAIQDYNTILATYAATLRTKANTFHTAINALNAGAITQTQHGFVSFSSHSAARPTPLFFPISGAQVHTRFGTQRRRLGKWTA